LTTAVKSQKKKQLAAQVDIEVSALREMMSVGQVQTIMKHVENSEFLPAFKQLIAIGALDQGQPAQLMAMYELVVRLMKKQAYKLATGNNRSDAAEAAPLYRTLIKAGHIGHHIQKNFAHCLLHEGKLDEAFVEIKTVLAKYQDSFAVAWVTCGEIRKAQGKLPEAIECYRHAARLSPEATSEGGDTQEIARAYLRKLNVESDELNKKE